MADDFLTTYAPLANDISGQTGLNPATVLGIIDTETGHGQHVLGNNIFGISPSGPRGQYVATYPDVQTASQAFVSLMQTPRYAPAATVTDPAVQAQLLVKGGYNTANPKYASVVAANAQNAVKQLGYQDGSGGPQNGASVNVTSSQPAPDYSGQPASAPPPASAAPDYNTPAPAAPAQPPASASAPAPPTGAVKGAAESDADFLQRTGAAVSGAKQGDPDADFLKRTGAAPSGTTATSAPPLGPLPSVSEYGDLGNQWWNTEAQPQPGQAPNNPAVNAIERVIQAGAEGGRGAVDASGWAPGGLQLGRYIVNPLLEVGGALLRGGQQAAAEIAEPLGRAVPQVTIPGYGPISGTIVGGPGLGRDVAALPEAFPTGFDTGGGNALQPEAPPPPSPKFISELTMPPREPGMSNLDRINQLIQHDDAETAGKWPQAAPTAPAPNLPPVPDGYVRLYHGGADPTSGGARWVTPDYAYARDYRPGQPVSYVDVPKDNPAVQAAVASHPDEPMRVASFNAPEDIAQQLKPVTAPTPQPTGAQVTPTSAAQMTPEEIATQRTVADKQWLNQTQQPGMKDTTERIPGITPNLVEQEQTVTAARELKALKNLNPELSQAEREILDQNTDLRKGFYADTVGSDVTRAADLKAANDKINTDLTQVWQGKGEADPANVQAQIQTELAGSAGDLPPLKSAMKQVGDSLENAGTDPQAMYRTHRLINYLQSRQGQLENPGYGAADVQAALTRTKGVLAQTIDDAAPGFGKAMSDYSGARGPIDAAKALQDRENGLYNGRGHISFLKVHGLLRDIIDAQKWDAPNDPLAGVSDAQMTRLKALHDDLKRVASAKELATAQGSDTAMNAVDIAKAYGKLASRAGVEGAANYAFGPGVGSMIVRGAENLLRPITSGIAARRQITRGMEILQPRPNPLIPPSP